MTNIDDLPLEIFGDILLKIDGITLGRCRRVCKQWREIIDGTDRLWQNICEREFKCSSKIARRKSGSDCKWYHIFKNLVMWSNIAKFDSELRDFYKFALHDKSHALDVDSGLLPLKDTRGIVIYDLNTLKYLPVVVPEKNCLKIASNQNTTVVLLKSGLSLQRNCEDPSFMTEAFFKADNFVLADNYIYFFNDRNVYKCDLTVQNLTSKLILQSKFDIKEIEYNNKILYLFTDCGQIEMIENDCKYSCQRIRIPVEWVRQIKHIKAVDNKNLVCYSRNLFKVETDKYQHLYLDFPPITALFFYGDITLIGTKTGEILLYRLTSQKKATKPIFEHLAKLPDGKVAVQIDVCERATGPVIVVATFFEIMIMEVNFFPQEHGQASKSTFTTSKLNMYKRLLKLKNRLQVY